HEVQRREAGVSAGPFKAEQDRVIPFARCGPDLRRLRFDLRGTCAGLDINRKTLPGRSLERDPRILLAGRVVENSDPGISGSQVNGASEETYPGIVAITKPFGPLHFNGLWSGVKPPGRSPKGPRIAR